MQCERKLLRTSSQKGLSRVGHETPLNNSCADQPTDQRRVHKSCIEEIKRRWGVKAAKGACPHTAKGKHAKSKAHNVRYCRVTLRALTWVPTVCRRIPHQWTGLQSIKQQARTLPSDVLAAGQTHMPLPVSVAWHTTPGFNAQKWH